MAPAMAGMADMMPSNRTILELKYFRTESDIVRDISSNRTILELKYCTKTKAKLIQSTSNRTILELKFGYLMGLYCGIDDF